MRSSVRSAIPAVPRERLHRAYDSPALNAAMGSSVATDQRGFRAASVSIRLSTRISARSSAGRS